MRRRAAADPPAHAARRWWSARDRVGRGARAVRARTPRSTSWSPTTACSTSRLARDAAGHRVRRARRRQRLLLPAGPLREPLPRACPADTRRALQRRASRRTPLPGCVARAAPGRRAAARRLVARPRAAAPTAGRRLRGRPLLAAAGMARAASASSTCCATQGLTFERDAGPARPRSVRSRCPGRADTPDVVVTEKDAVKLPPGTRTAQRGSGSCR